MKSHEEVWDWFNRNVRRSSGRVMSYFKPVGAGEYRDLLPSDWRSGIYVVTRTDNVLEYEWHGMWIASVDADEETVITLHDFNDRSKCNYVLPTELSELTYLMTRDPSGEHPETYTRAWRWSDYMKKLLEL